MDVDPIRYEMFLHRLWAVGEEGRSTLQRVTASPIVAQGGEVMSSFYDSAGKMVLACSGHLRFAAARTHCDRGQIAKDGAPVITPAVVRGRRARVHRLPLRNSDLASLPRR